MGPRKETELPHVVLLHQRQHEPHETHAVQTEGDEPVICYQKLEVVLETKNVI